MPTRRLFIVGLFLAMIGVGCGSPPSSGASTRTPPTTPWPEMAPPDFALAVSVASPSWLESRSRTLPRALRSGRYMVEPGGRLRWGAGRSKIAAPLPPVVRQLEASDSDALWRALLASGLLDTPIEAIDTGFDTSDSRAVAKIDCLADDRRVVISVPLDRTSTEAIASERLIDRLADLAWVK